MRNTATQNPANKVARNSGAGEAGISEIVPTPEEAQRGLEPIGGGGSTTGGSWRGRFGAGLGAAAMIGVGVGALAVRRARQRRSIGARLADIVRWR